MSLEISEQVRALARKAQDGLREQFERRLKELTGRTYTFIPLSAAPVAGAVLWALEAARGATPEMAVRQRVMDALSGR